MPNYLYKCNICETIYDIFLPISHDPKLLYKCEQNKCNGLCNRIMRQWGAVKGFKVFAGDWFKKKYGHDIGESAEDKIQQKKDWETLEQQFKKDKEC